MQTLRILIRWLKKSRSALIEFLGVGSSFNDGRTLTVGAWIDKHVIREVNGEWTYELYDDILAKMWKGDVRHGSRGIWVKYYCASSEYVIQFLKDNIGYSTLCANVSSIGHIFLFSIDIYDDSCVHFWIKEIASLDTHGFWSGKMPSREDVIRIVGENGYQVKETGGKEPKGENWAYVEWLLFAEYNIGSPFHNPIYLEPIK